MTLSLWRLAIYSEPSEHNSLLATREFADLPALRLALIENRGRQRLVITPPSTMTAADRTTLLDMRSQGFNIQIK